MISKKVTIHDPMGLHLRPAGTFCKYAIQFQSHVEIKKGNATVNGKSLLNVLAAGIKENDTIEIICNGADEKEALEKLVSLVDNGFEPLDLRKHD
ncbi:MAG: HPr family phosphocarrier protein [Clostridiales bacterium]|nr:HPr family phosphocarrier protein [Clostridiales bacterium]